jgi:putative transposase
MEATQSEVNWGTIRSTVALIMTRFPAEVETDVLPLIPLILGWSFPRRFSWLEEGAEAMKASKFSDAQKAFIVKRGEEGVPIAEICREAGISQATYFNWRKKYAGLMPSEMKRLRELEHENSRLKKIVADLSLDKEMLQDIVKRKL